VAITVADGGAASIGGRRLTSPDGVAPHRPSDRGHRHDERRKKKKESERQPHHYEVQNNEVKKIRHGSSFINFKSTTKW
jgi:ribosomal protein S8E